MKDSDLVFRVEGLGKKYTLHHAQAQPKRNLREAMVYQSRRLGRRLNPFTLAGHWRQAQHHAARLRQGSEEEFWALKDVNFEIRRGERVGIIGRNGAGKSTLLKILSRITEPTTGRVELRGRVASLLEVGTGIHPELTGRENIYLNGAILGMSRREIHRNFDEIVEFAEVEKFLDTPVKRYSSGMYVRLAFAVAAHLEPEILVVDEVLAVGDASFQKKCLGKMEDAAEREGRTVLFVSHNMSAIKSLCNIGIILSAGRLYKHTTIGEATQAYEMVDFSCSRVYSASFIETGKFPGDHQIRLIRASIEQNQMVGPFAHDDPIDIRIEVECGDNARLKRVSVVIIDSSGIAILHTDNALSRGQDKHLNRGRNHLLFHIPPGI